MNGRRHEIAHDGLPAPAYLRTDVDDNPEDKWFRDSTGVATRLI